MKEKNAKKKSKGKAGGVRSKARRVQPRLVHRERDDLQLKDYLMEDHPELGLPLEDMKSLSDKRISRAAKT